jgi:hypothetical protein
MFLKTFLCSGILPQGIIQPNCFTLRLIVRTIMAWCGVAIVWHGTAWYGVAWHGVMWYGMVWCGMVWYGVALHGMVWCGIVWCCMVWCGYLSYMYASEKKISLT